MKNEHSNVEWTNTKFQVSNKLNKCQSRLYITKETGMIQNVIWLVGMYGVWSTGQLRFQYPYSPHLLTTPRRGYSLHPFQCLHHLYRTIHCRGSRGESVDLWTTIVSFCVRNFSPYHCLKRRLFWWFWLHPVIASTEP